MLLVVAETLLGAPGAVGRVAALILEEASERVPSPRAFTATTLN